MELLYACTLCDEKIAKSGRGGHLKFSDGNGHGPRGEMPDGYDDNTEDYFVEAEADASEDEPVDTDEDTEDTAEAEGNDQSSESDVDPDEGNAQPPADKPDAGASESNPLARIKRFLTTPVKDL